MKKFLNFLLAFFPYLIVFIGSIYTSNDPDLGWHLKNGEYFLKHHQILRDNPYTSLMPNFHWANVSWGTDIITYIAYHFGGFLGLSLLGALIVTLTFYFFSKAACLSVWDQIFLFSLLLFLESPINAVSFRGQQISLLFLGVLFYLISLYPKSKKILYATIPLFLLWVNLHGEFLLGLVMFLGWMLVYILQKLLSGIEKNTIFETIKNNLVVNKKEIFFLLLIFTMSLLATLINPFGVGIHMDALYHVGSPLLKNIAEYLPFNPLSQPWWNQVVVAVFLGIGLIFLYFREKLSTQIPALFSILLLYILSFSVRRYAWPAYYLILPILKPIPGFLKPDSKKVTNITSFILLAILLVITVAGKLPFENFQKFNWNAYCKDESMLCSPASASYLRDHQLTSNLYTLYGWGGYLIWNYPEIKPVIDGRMHMWRDEKGYSGFEDYYSYEQDKKDIDKTNYNVVYISPEKPLYNQMIRLTQLGKWKLVYKDRVSGIFVRN